MMKTKPIIETSDLPKDVVLSCRKVGICYRQPFKMFSRGKDREYWPFRNLSFDLRHGETLGVQGRNGAGKSTLLRLLARVTHPDSGQFLVRPKLNIQLLSINLGFERILSGRENALMAGMLLGKSRRHMLARMQNIEAFSELGSYIDQPVYTYSNGMRARLGFSIAMQADPDVLLLDEVLAVGDQSFRNKSKQTMKALINSGKSVVLVMHNRQTLDEMCDRVIEL